MPTNAVKLEAIAELKKLAAELGRPLTHLALAFDRIDEIVPPGTDLNKLDADYTPPALADKTLRRR